MLCLTTKRARTERVKGTEIRAHHSASGNKDSPLTEVAYQYQATLPAQCAPSSQRRCYRLPKYTMGEPPRLIQTKGAKLSVENRDSNVPEMAFVVPNRKSSDE